jgi:hypothetical protein
MWKQSIIGIGILLIFGCADDSRNDQLSSGCSEAADPIEERQGTAQPVPVTVLEGTWLSNCFEGSIDGTLYYFRETAVFRGDTISSTIRSYEEVPILEELEMPEEEVPEVEGDTLEPPEEEGVPLEDFSGRNLFRSYHPTTSFLVAAATDYCKIGGTPIYIVSGTFSVSNNTPVFEDKDLTRLDSKATPSLLPLNSDTSMSLGVPFSSTRYFYIDGNIMYPTDGGGLDGVDEPITEIYWEHYWVRQ